MMEDLSLHILDVVENSLAAKARKVVIRIEESPARDRLTLVISDDGRGMGRRRLTRALDPFFTTKGARRIGLGLPFLAQAAEAAGGKLSLSSEPGRGTRVRAAFRLSHPDLQPLGDIAETMSVLVAAHPETDFRYTHVTDSGRYAFGSLDFVSSPRRPARRGCSAPSAIRKEINSGLARLRRRP